MFLVCIVKNYGIESDLVIELFIFLPFFFAETENFGGVHV